jgi:hypothetical protein
VPGFLFHCSRHAATQDFYQGKMIRIVVGFSPGGAFDVRAPFSSFKQQK